MNLPDIEIIKNIIKKSDRKIKSAETDLIEKFYDDSVSRYYYAVFHAISALLITKNLTFSSHNQTLGAFNKEFIHTGIFPTGFSKKIELLFRQRQTDDYDVKSYIDKNQAEIALLTTKKIINKIIKYLSALYNVDKNFWN
jgi:uncharacterized protein (UPF0332 family)